MAKEGFTATDSLQTLLTQLIETHRSELVNRYQQVLREGLFNSRALVRPSMLKTIASDEVDTFGNFLHLSPQHALNRGVQLYHTGLGEQPMLRMSQVTRQFFVTHLDNGQIGAALEVIDAYQERVVQGFIQSLEKAIISEQERTRHAFERVTDRDKS